MNNIMGTFLNSNCFFLQTDWNDGRTLCSIVRNLGGPAPAYDKIDTDSSMWEHNIQMGKCLNVIY